MLLYILSRLGSICQGLASYCISFPSTSWQCLPRLCMLLYILHRQNLHKGGSLILLPSGIYTSWEFLLVGVYMRYTQSTVPGKGYTWYIFSLSI